jgi:recombination protein RecA
MSQVMRKLTGSVSRTKTILIFINQIREKIGITWGSNETTPGGRALKFYSSVRLDVRRIDSLKNGAEIVGSRVRVKVVKNKTAVPFKKAEFDIQYGTGISKEGSLLDVALEHDIVRKSGAWFIYGDDQLGQGRENAKSFLAENPDIATEIELKIKDKLGLLDSDQDAVEEVEDK